MNNSKNHNLFKKNERYFHGSRISLEMDLKKDHIFISTNERFANKFGDIVYELNVDLGNVFDTTNIVEIEKIYNKFFLNKLEKNIFINQLTNNNNWSFVEKISSIIFNNGFESIKVFEEGTLNYLIKSKNVKYFKFHKKWISITESFKKRLLELAGIKQSMN